MEIQSTSEFEDCGVKCNLTNFDLIVDTLILFLCEEKSMIKKQRRLILLAMIVLVVCGIAPTWGLGAELLQKNEEGLITRQAVLVH